MFNLTKQSQVSNDILTDELRIFGVIDQPDTSYKCCVGDELVACNSIDECYNLIKQGISELKESLWSDWQDLANLATIIINSEHPNSGSLDNLVFLNSVKKSYLLSKVFSDLSEVSSVLKNLFNVDTAMVHENLVGKFNMLYLRIKLVHHLIMRESYRLQLISRSKKMNKTAQISGPWANLDLPMKERVWDWDEDEEYFDDRSRARREQVRYNPENNKMGFYYVWQDLNRDPYLFEDMKEDSPYKSRHLLTIP